MFVPGFVADPRCLGCLHLYGPQVPVVPQFHHGYNQAPANPPIPYLQPPPKPVRGFRRASQMVPPPYGHHLTRLSRSSSRASFSSAISQIAEPPSPKGLPPKIFPPPSRHPSLVPKKFEERRRSVTFGELPTEIQSRINPGASLPSLKIVEQSDILKARLDKLKDVRDEEIQCNLGTEKNQPKKRAVHRLKLGRVWMTARSPKCFRKNIPEGVVLQTGEWFRFFRSKISCHKSADGCSCEHTAFALRCGCLLALIMSCRS